MRVGDTVSLRVVTPAGPTDVVGTLVAATPEQLTVRRRSGETVTIDPGDVRQGRVVPPGPARLIDTAALERIAALGWRALETAPLGDWLLRASGGVTSRANSVLPLGSPGLPIDEAVRAVEEWYAERRLPPRMQVPSGAVDPAVEDVLRARGWRPETRVTVMTAELGPVLRGLPDGAAGGQGGAVVAGVVPGGGQVGGESDVVPQVQGAGRSEVPLAGIAAEPDEAWLACWRPDSGPAGAAARQLLTNHPDVAFVSIRAGSECLAVARVAVDGRWAGLFSVEVSPAHRRRGLARAVSAAGLRWAVRRGARRGYLQAVATEVAARSLYASVGFSDHHDYVHWVGGSH